MESMALNIYREVYRGKRVFVTGHTGFKGSWLLFWLHEIGAVVKGYAFQPEQNDSLYEVLNCDSLCESIIGDIRNKEDLRHALVSFEPDFVFHLAAQPLVADSYNNPVYTYETNVIGTANVLDALRYLEKPCIAIMITTDKVYYNDETGRPYHENDRLGGFDPYSASKAAAEVVIDSFRKSFFHTNHYDMHRKSISSVRSGNVIGGGDWSTNRLIPDLVRAIISGRELVIRNPKSIRPWQHVLDCLGGYLLLGCKQSVNPRSFFGAFNFGPKPEEAFAVEKVIQQSIGIWGKGKYAIASEKVFHEAALLSLDISKAADLLNWYPAYDGCQAIEETINWYKEFYERPDTIDTFTLKQIAQYEISAAFRWNLV